MEDIDLSIVIPTYNSIAKMEKTIASLISSCELMNAEVIFVDDCSSDGTYENLQEIASEWDNWTVYRLDSNSGSAAAPRNFGIEKAAGTWVYFLDSDDILEPRSLEEALLSAKSYNYDVVRTSLKVRMGDGSIRTSDMIPRWDHIKDRVSKIRAITKYQSLTCSFLMKRGLLMENGIRFDISRRIGEDIKFTSEVLVHSQRIGYRATPSRIYVRNSVGVESVTQKINSSQFADFIKSWNEVQETLSVLGVSFVLEHGFAAIQYALRQFVWFRSEDLSKDSFELFADFCTRYSSEITAFNFRSRFQDLVDAALTRDYEGFKNAYQLRVLIAGHDLKFMSEISEKLALSCAVEVDQWSGHTEHDETISKQLLEWADLIWVEWLLGAAEWYSKNVNGDQRLIIRAHRSEIVADYGLRVNDSQVAAYISIAPHILGDLADRFDIRREKLWLIPNALDVDSYATGTYTANRLNRIAMVGTVPKLKGYLGAIGMLAELKTEFPDLELHTYGKRASELPWVESNAEESAYFAECERLIEEFSLQDSVVHHGWVDTKEALAKNAVVISMSDFEGMQVSVAEGFCSGGLGMTLNWRGARQGYPSKWVFENEDSLREGLASVLRGEVDLEKESIEGRSLIRDLYSIDKVWPKVENLIKMIRA